MNDKADQQQLQQALPCPFCGSTDLTSNLWALEESEVGAIECNNCYAGAPFTTWNTRADQEAESWQQQLQDNNNEKPEDLLHL